MIAGQMLPSPRQQVNRQHIHRVHQENPDKKCQTQRGNGFSRLFIVDDAPTHIVHKLEQDFHCSLETSGNACCCFFCTTPQQEAADYAQQSGEENRIQINKREIGNIFQALTLSNIRQTGQAL